MPLRKLLFFLPLLALVPTAPRPDYAGLYRDGPRLEADTRREGDSLRVYLRLPSVSGRISATRALRLTAWPGYEARQPLWQDSIAWRGLHLRDDSTGAERGSFCVAVARVPVGTVLHLQTGPPGPEPEGYQDAINTAWLTVTAERLGRTFVVTDSVGQPLLRRYVRVGEIFGVDCYGLYQPVRWRRYDAAATAALPPHVLPGGQPSGPRTLAVLDSATAGPGAMLRFVQPGLVALRVGGAGGVAVRTLALLVAANDYPNLTTAAELIEPLLYLTTSQERQKLTSAPDPKRAVDRFWLDIARGDQARGRSLIRSYYGRVTAANRLFAAHKAGWLTDRGLLYVVLGPPPSVRRLADGGEQWRYPDAGEGGGPVTFGFRPRPSTFAPDYYELVRRPEYELLWYAAVEKWRTPTTAPSGPNGRNGR